jgi:hypothetical protein
MSNFSYKDAKGNLVQIPVRYGDMSRQAALAQRKNSENTIPSAPFIACNIKNLEIARNRLQEPTHISKVQIRERDTWINPATGVEEYINIQGENYTVERLMPVPYNLVLTSDLWTTNTDQKLQIIEQLLVLFRPSLELQTTDNYLDWTSLSTIELTDMTFTNRSIPQGTEQDIDICNMQFTTPIWITTPAKVKQLGIVTKIITNTFVDAAGTIESGAYQNYQEIDYFSGRTPTAIGGATIGNFSLLVLNGSATLVDPAEGPNINWYRILDLFPGKFTAGLSQLRLMKPNGTEITARISLDPTNESVMHLDIDQDTIPQNTEVPPNSGKTYVDAIIDPTTFVPVNPAMGIRYLILEDINTNPELVTPMANGDAASAWRNDDGTYLVAHANDIITWNGSHWFVIFNSSSVTDFTYITNIRTGLQYVWDGTMWSKSYEGEYSKENWRLIL